MAPEGRGGAEGVPPVPAPGAEQGGAGRPVPPARTARPGMRRGAAQARRAGLEWQVVCSSEHQLLGSPGSAASLPGSPRRPAGLLPRSNFSTLCSLIPPPPAPGAGKGEKEPRVRGGGKKKKASTITAPLPLPIQKHKINPRDR